MTEGVERERPPPARRRWLAFMNCGPSLDLPALPQTATSSSSHDVPCALLEQGNEGLDAEIAGAVRAAKCRPSSASETGGRRLDGGNGCSQHSEKTRRPSTAHAVLQSRGGALGANASRLASRRASSGNEYQGEIKRGSQHHPQRMGTRPARPPPCCPQCGMARRPRGPPPRGRMPGRWPPPRAMMGREVANARPGMSMTPAMRMRGRGPPPPHPPMGVSGRGPRPPRMIEGREPPGAMRGSGRSRGRGRAGRIIRGPRGPMMGPRGRGPMIGPGGRIPAMGPRGRGPVMGPRGAMMGPRGPMLGRGRGPRPPRPGMMASSGLGSGQSASPDELPAAPSWMAVVSSPDDDDDFAQPVPVAKPAPMASAGESLTQKAEATAPRMPPWAKRCKSTPEDEPAPTGSADVTNAATARRPSLGGGMPTWGPKMSTTTKADDKPVEVEHKGAATVQPRQEGLPDWLQSTSAVSTTAHASMSRAKDDGVSVSAMDANSGGGLDWLQAAVQSKPAMVSTAEPKGQKAETGASQNANDTGGETVETDWLQAALRGSAPAKVSPAVAKESTPTELSGSNDWLSSAALGGGGGGGGARPERKRRRSSVTPGGWMSGKLGLRVDDDDENGSQAAILAAKPSSAASPKAAKPSSSTSVPGGWLSSGKLGVSTGDESEEEQVDATAVLKSKTKSKKKERNGKSKKSRSAAMSTEAGAAVFGGWLSQAVSTGTFGTQQEDEEESEDDSEVDPAGVSPATVAQSTGGETGRRSSLGGGMPSWAPAKPVPPQQATLEGETQPQSRGLGGGRPPWAPAPPQAKAAPVEQTTEVEETSKVPANNTADVTSDEKGGLPDWLSVAAAGNIKHKTDAIPSGGESGGGPGCHASGTQDTGPQTEASAEDVLAAALSGKPIRSASPVKSAPAGLGHVVRDARRDDDVGDSGGAASLDWLSAAAVGGTPSKKRGSVGPKSPRAPGGTVAGGWLSSGKLGVSSEESSDGEDGPKRDAGEKKGVVSPKKGSEKKKSKLKITSSSTGATNAPGGWLAAGIAMGTLGAMDNDTDGDEASDQDGGSRDGPKMVSSSTQWEEGDGEGKPKVPTRTLPPWAKKWTQPAPDPPPLVQEVKPKAIEAQPETKVSGLDWINSAASGGPEQVASGDCIGSSTDVEEASGTSDGLNWLTEAAGPGNTSSSTHAFPQDTTREAVASFTSGALLGTDDNAGGMDWLLAAQSGGHTSTKSRRPPVKADVKTAPGGWLTGGKLGMSTSGDSDEEVDRAGPEKAGSEANFSRVPKKGKKSQPKQETSDAVKGAAAAPGGWLAAAITSGNLGVSDGGGDGSDDNSDQEGNDGKGPKMVTSATQWEEQGGSDASKLPTRTLPPWAKKWTPPAPDPPAVPEKIEEACGEPDAKPRVSGLDWISGAIADAPVEVDSGTNGSSSTDANRSVSAGGGLSWLTQAASSIGPATRDAVSGDIPAGSATTTGDEGLDWLTAAQSGEQVRAQPRRVSVAPAAKSAPGGWLTAGKLGVSTKDDSDDDGVGNDLPTPKAKSEKKGTGKAAPAGSAATAGWLSSGALGVPVDDESDIEAGDESGSSRPTAIEQGTQTDENIGEIVMRETGPKLPPWAKRWTPPTPKAEIVPDAKPESASAVTAGAPEEESKPEGTPDWILASMGSGKDESPVQAEEAKLASGSEGGGLTWLAQAADPSSEPDAGSQAPNAGESGGSDWLQQAVGSGSVQKRHRNPAERDTPRRAVGKAPGAGAAPLSWMGKVTRRSSMDLEDSTVEASIAEAKAKAVPGGWLQVGSLGAPDSVEEERELQEARAASSLASNMSEGDTMRSKESNPSSTSKVPRKSFEGGLPAWAPALTKSAHSSSASVIPDRRPSLAGGAPPWAPRREGNQEGSTPRTNESDPQSDTPKRRPSLGGGMPPWVPAEKVAACETTDNSRQRRPTLGGGMPAWGPASAPRPLDSSCVSLESKPGESSDVPAESETPVKLIESTVPTWLAAAAAGGTEASDQANAKVPAQGAQAQDEEGDDGASGLNWLTEAARSEQPSKPMPSFLPKSAAVSDIKSKANSPDAYGEDDADWLSVAARSDKLTKKTTPCEGVALASSSSVERKQSSASLGWLAAASASGSLGLRADSDGIVDVAAIKYPERITREASKSSAEGKLLKRATGVASGGWLAAAVTSGRLGAPGDEHDEEVGSENGPARCLTANAAVQTDEVMITEVKEVKEPEAPKLPPWAKRWTPRTTIPVTEPAQAALVANKAPSVAPAITTPSHACGLDWVKAAVDNTPEASEVMGSAIHQNTTDDSKKATPAPSSGDVEPEREGESGLSWLMQAAKDQPRPVPNSARERESAAGPESTQTASMIASTVSVEGDWLMAAASGALRDESATPSTARRKPSVGTTPHSISGGGGGWIATHTLRLSTGVSDVAQNSAIGAKNDSRPKAATAQGSAGGWLMSGRLGVPGADDDVGGGDAECASDDPMRARVGVTVETQTDESIAQAVNDAATPKLPPWAKRWNPPAPAATTVDAPPPVEKDSSGSEESGLVAGLPSLTPTIDWIAGAAVEPTTSMNPGCNSAGGGSGVEWVSHLESSKPPAQARQNDVTAHVDVLTAALSGTVIPVSSTALIQKSSGSDASEACDWLTSAATADQSRPKARPTAPRDKHVGIRSTAVHESWLTHGKLGVSNDADDVDQLSNSVRVEASVLRQSSAKQHQQRSSAAAAMGGRHRNTGLDSTATSARAVTSAPRSWLAAGIRFDAVDTQASDGDEEDLRHAATVVSTATVGTQWEEDGGDGGLGASSSTKSRLPPWAKPYTPPPKAVASEDACTSSAHEKSTAELGENHEKVSSAVPDWIAASMEGKAAPLPSDAKEHTENTLSGSDAGLDWLQQATTMTSAPGGNLDWLVDAASKPTSTAFSSSERSSKTRSSGPSPSATRGHRSAPSPLSWMAGINKRVSMNQSDDDEDKDGEGDQRLKGGEHVKSAASVANKGGWLACAVASGALGAPDAIEDVEALRKDQALVAPQPLSVQKDERVQIAEHRSSTRRLPPWAPGNSTHAGPISAAPRRRSSLDRGLPAWVPARVDASASSSSAVVQPNRRRSSLDAGLPAWAPGGPGAGGSETDVRASLRSEKAQTRSENQPPTVLNTIESTRDEAVSPAVQLEVGDVCFPAADTLGNAAEGGMVGEPMRGATMVTIAIQCGESMTLRAATNINTCTSCVQANLDDEG